MRLMSGDWRAVGCALSWFGRNGACASALDLWIHECAPCPYIHVWIRAARTTWARTLRPRWGTSLGHRRKPPPAPWIQTAKMALGPGLSGQGLSGGTPWTIASRSLTPRRRWAAACVRKVGKWRAGAPSPEALGPGHLRRGGGSVPQRDLGGPCDAEALSRSSRCCSQSANIPRQVPAVQELGPGRGGDGASRFRGLQP